VVANMRCGHIAVINSMPIALLLRHKHALRRSRCWY
jgi:hypothetical protein